MITIGRLVTRLERQAKAWAELASEDEFAGMTLETFRTEITKLQVSREELLQAQTQLKGALQAREAAERVAMRSSKRVAMGMKIHPNHGEDSPLVKASGFVTESDRRSGLTRKGYASSTGD